MNFLSSVGAALGFGGEESPSGLDSSSAVTGVSLDDVRFFDLAGGPKRCIFISCSVELRRPPNAPQEASRAFELHIVRLVAEVRDLR